MSPTWIKDSIDILGTGVKIWTERKRLRDLCIRAAKTIAGGRKNIGIFGVGGTGKTTLGELLTGKLDPWSTDPLKYEESPRTEKPSKEEGTVPMRVWVAPGQARNAGDEGMAKTRGGIDLSVMLDKVGQGDFHVIINVVSWGYAAFDPARLAEVSSETQSTSLNAHLKSYLTKCREAEEVALKRVVGRLHSETPERLTLLTVVTKADLWWHDRQSVQTHYNNVCRDAFKSASLTRGERFQHRIVPASLVRTNLLDQDQSLIHATAEGYDDWRHLQFLHELLSEVETALS